MSQKVETQEEPSKSEFFAATNNGSKGCRWHIFKKTSNYNTAQESLCGKFNADKLRRNSTQKPLENLDLDSSPGLGKYCHACKLAAKKRLNED